MGDPPSAVEWFGNANIAVKYGIIITSLILLVIIAGFIKLAWDKRRVRKYAARMEQERRTNKVEKDVETADVKEEGELFGVRAIEHGFFGGVAQSRPSSVASSRSPSLYGRPVSTAGSINNPPVPNNSIPATPKIPRPPPLRMHSSPSAISLPLKSPLSQNSITAEELRRPQTSSSERHLPLPSPLRLRGDPLPPRPATSSDRFTRTPSPATSPSPSLSPELTSSQAPQIDLPGRGFSPAFPSPIEFSAPKPVENAEESSTPSKHVRSFSRPLSMKSLRSSKAIDVDSIPLPGPTFKRQDTGERSQSSDHSYAELEAKQPVAPAGSKWGNALVTDINGSFDEPYGIAKSDSSKSSKDPFADGDSRTSRSSSKSSVYSEEGTTTHNAGDETMERTTSERLGGFSSRTSLSWKSSSPPARYELGMNDLPPVLVTSRSRLPKQRPQSRSMQGSSPPIELELLHGKSFPKPPHSSYAPKLSPQNPTRAENLPGTRAPGSTLSPPNDDKPGDSSSPTRLGIESESHLAVASTGRKGEAKASRNPALRLTSDALSDLYDSYWRRSLRTSVDETKHARNPSNTGVRPPVGQPASPVKTTITITRAPPPPPPPSTPPPGASLSTNGLSVGSATLVSHTVGLAAGQRAEVLSGEEGESAKLVEQVAAGGLNPRLMAYTMGGSTGNSGRGKERFVVPTRPAGMPQQLAVGRAV